MIENVGSKSHEKFYNWIPGGGRRGEGRGYMFSLALSSHIYFLLFETYTNRDILSSCAPKHVMCQRV